MTSQAYQLQVKLSRLNNEHRNRPTGGRLSQEAANHFMQAELVSWMHSPGYGTEEFCRQIEALGDFIYNAITPMPI